MERASVPSPLLQPQEVCCDPPVRETWRPQAPAVALGALMMALTVAVAVTSGLPIRDADGLLGGRMALLLGTLLAFFALEIIPRALRARVPGVSFAAAARRIVAERWSRRRVKIVAIGLVSFYATYLSYRNLKSFLPFVVEQNNDTTLLTLERGLFGGTDPTMWLQHLFGTGIVAHILSSAYLFYLGFIPISLGAALILTSNPVPGLWWVTALGMNWSLGAASYYLLPAMGPAFVDPTTVAALPQTGVAALQEALWAHRAEVLTDPYATTQVQSIAAFASLHVSVVFSAALIAHLVRVPRALRWGLWAFLGVTIVATVYFGWHYVLDDVAGLVIGGLAVVLSAVLTGHRRLLWSGRGG